MITFSHTLLQHEEDTGVSTVLVVCPLNTVLNWYNEWFKWVDKRVRPEVHDSDQITFTSVVS